MYPKNLADVCSGECQVSKEALWVSQLNRVEEWLKPFLTDTTHRSVSSQWPEMVLSIQIIPVLITFLLMM
jgi:hypothetical protein